MTPSTGHAFTIGSSAARVRIESCDPRAGAAPMNPPSWVRTLASGLPEGGLLTDSADCWVYGYDNSRQHACPQAVALVETAAHVQHVVRTCRTHHVPIVARGRGTNTTGATVPVGGGIVLSFERMNRIVDVDVDSRYAVVQPGVLNGELQRQLAPMGFFWAPDPTSADYSTVGGNLGCNAAGPRALKYGSCRENTLGLEAVVGTGERIVCGTYTTKGAVGYDLTRLLIGSEGTLALITQATLKLTPLPARKVTLRACYDSVAAAARAVARIMAQAETPCALEFMDDRALDLVRNHMPGDLPQGAKALLLLEVDGDGAALAGAASAVRRAAEGPGSIRIDEAADQEASNRLWTARKALSPALRQLAPQKINEDVVVPVAHIATLVDQLQRIAQAHALPIVSFGHAGNGNLHVNIMLDPRRAEQARAAQQALAEVFSEVLRLKGTLSGEHGIGLAKRDFMPQALGAETLGLMHAIKRQFDPENILNPGKVLPADPA